MRKDFLPYGIHSIDEEGINEVVSVLKSEWLTTGPKVAEFEKNLAHYAGAKHATAVNSGTSALDIAVQSLKLPPGSEIITTPFTFAATANCALYNNCIPVFADIDQKTYNISPEEIEKKITEKTKAIIYVDYAGQPCDIDEILEIAKKHNLYTIEDACHALGARYKGNMVGSQADVSIFSFHPVKHITTGEGGALTTNSKEMDDMFKMLRNHGMDKSAMERFGKNAGYLYDIKMLGRNYRITDIQCALGVSQLKKIESFVSRRNEIAKIYNEEFSGIDEITTPFVKDDVRHAFHLYTILLDRKINRDDFFSKMRSLNIGVNVHYIPTYKFTTYQKFNINQKSFPVTEDIFSRIISLPLFPKMTTDDITDVVEAVKESLA